MKHIDNNVDEYSSKISAEKATYKDNINVHELPDIFHYWSNKYLKPKMNSLDIQDVHDLFVKSIIQLFEQTDQPITIASLGSGNCDFEVQLSKRILKQKTHIPFKVHCFEINKDMIKRGQALAVEENMSHHFNFFTDDVNKIKFMQQYDMFIANQSLHHFVNLEHILASIRSFMKPNGYFIISDMIGRNGHMRWPEAYEVIRNLWQLLEDKKKWNHQLKRQESMFDNWDCSKEGFEGIRSQDILPLLIKHFNFELFFAFSNIIDIFIDRSFGHNFDQNDPYDRAFIDYVAELDNKLIREGKIKPTHIMARMKKESVETIQFFEGMSPSKCLRNPSL